MYRDRLFTSSWENELEKSAVVPDQAQGIKNFVDDCLYEVSNEALIKLGTQGGYVNIPGQSYYGNVGLSGNRLSMFSNNALEVAYWLYTESNGVQKLAVPSIDMMERELNGYVKEGFIECIGGFSDYEAQGYYIEYGSVVVESDIREEDVLFKVTMPLHIEINDFSFDFLPFYRRAEVKFGKLLDLAFKIMEKENEEYFFEEKALDILRVYDEVPYDGVLMECLPRFWTVEGVKRDFRNILFNNIQFIKVKNTDYNTGTKYNYFIWDVGVDEPDLQVNFMYMPGWPVDFLVEPNENGVMQSESVTTNVASGFGAVLSSIICMHNYHFVYSIRYPILVSLHDPAALDGEGFSLNFALQAIIENNQPRMDTRSGLYYGVEDDGYCERVGSLLSVDSFDDEGSRLDNVTISYNCLASNCFIGRTNEEGMLDELAPSCFNGVLTATKEPDYHKDSVIISTNTDAGVSVTLEKFYILNYSVDVVRKGASLSRVGSELTSSEKAVIVLENEEKDYTTVLVYPDMKEVKLISGDYQVQSYILSEGKVSIPGQTINKCVDVPKDGLLGIIGQTKQECFDVKIDPVEVNQVMSGGNSYDWRVTKSSLINGEEILFYIPYYGVSKSIEDINSTLNQIEGGDVIYPKII